MNYLEYLENNQQNLINAIVSAVKFRSVREPQVRTKDGEVYPFGKGVQEAFEYIMELGRQMGFKTENFGNYGGHIEWTVPGAKQTFGIVGHVDVVPEGDGWDSEPYEAVVRDGYLYGRGVLDDKGPVLSCLYAMAALKNAGIQPNYNIRLILGLDEETSKEGIEAYLEQAGHPDLGFTPDGDFPVIHGEMGILIFDFAQKLKKQNVNDGLVLNKVVAGTAPNAVPRTARAVIASKDKHDYEVIRERVEAYAAETEFNIKSRKTGSSLSIEAVGKAAHGSTPEQGLNAFSILMDFLGRIHFAAEDLNDFIGFYNEKIAFNLHGEGLGCELEDEPSGKLIFNVGTAEFNDSYASYTINVRYPVTCTGEQVYEAIEKNFEGTSIGLIKGKNDPPLYLEASHPLVEKLMEAYREETGDAEAQPMVIGGGTYAKVFNNVLAFGPLFPGEEDTIHQPNERISLESLSKMTRIFAKAIINVCCEEAEGAVAAEASAEAPSEATEVAETAEADNE